jgi:hypothetical protein
MHPASGTKPYGAIHPQALPQATGSSRFITSHTSGLYSRVPTALVVARLSAHLRGVEGMVCKFCCLGWGSVASGGWFNPYYQNCLPCHSCVYR